MEKLSNPIPHLTTALKGPLLQLESHLLAYQTKIEAWFREQWLKNPAPITSSVDLRNAGFKIAPVDTNVFPAGFNNLNPDFLPLAIQAAQSVISTRFPNCKRILLIPESHTRNPFYFKSLSILQEIIKNAGYDVRIGSLLPELKEPFFVELNEDHLKLELVPIIKNDQKIGLKEFSPCLLLLNNDFSEGIPGIFNDVKQSIAPPLHMAWASRSKSNHFQHLDTVSDAFAKEINLDPWLIKPLSVECDDVDFVKRRGEDRIVEKTELLLQEIYKKYEEYGVKEKPFVVIKADAGTYGMGVMMVQSAEEILRLNRKERTRMSVTKGSQPITKVLIQEGVHSFETWKDAVAEPVVYLFGQYVIGGFYRVHKERGAKENLNAPGMHFESLAFAQPCNNPNSLHRSDNCEEVNRFYTYSVIARLASLAAAKERDHSHDA